MEANFKVQKILKFLAGTIVMVITKQPTLMDYWINFSDLYINSYFKQIKENSAFNISSLKKIIKSGNEWAKK